MRCQACGEADLASKRRSVDYSGVKLGRFTLLVCPVCGFEAVDQNVARRLDEAIDAAWKSGRLQRPAGANAKGGPRPSRRGLAARRPADRALLRPAPYRPRPSRRS